MSIDSEEKYSPDKEKAKIESEKLTKGLNVLLDFARSEDHLKEIGLGEYSSELYSIADKIVKERDKLEAIAKGEASPDFIENEETEKSWAEQEMERYKNQGEENIEAEKKKKWLEKYESEEGINERVEAWMTGETKEGTEEFIKWRETKMKKGIENLESEHKKSRYFLEKLKVRNDNRTETDKK